MVLKIILLILLIVISHYISCILHELSHILFCKILKCKIKSYKVGFIKYSGQIEINFKGNSYCHFSTNNKNKALTILLSGSIVNLLFLISNILLVIFVKKKWLSYYLYIMIIVNIISTFADIIPIFNNDGKAIISIFNEKKKE